MMMLGNGVSRRRMERALRRRQRSRDRMQGEKLHRPSMSRHRNVRGARGVTVAEPHCAHDGGGRQCGGDSAPEHRVGERYPPLTTTTTTTRRSDDGGGSSRGGRRGGSGATAVATKRGHRVIRVLRSGCLHELHRERQQRWGGGPAIVSCAIHPSFSSSSSCIIVVVVL